MPTSKDRGAGDAVAGDGEPGTRSPRCRGHRHADPAAARARASPAGRGLDAAEERRREHERRREESRLAHRIALRDDARRIRARIERRDEDIWSSTAPSW